MVDAGYRWATSTLEEAGIVERDQPISGGAVLAAPLYWLPDEPGSAWLIEGVLPRVRDFLSAHSEHEVRFGDLDELAGSDDFGFLDWLDVSADAVITPRYFVEVLGFTSWGEVVEWLHAHEAKPWWWSDTEGGDAARRRFLDLVKRT
jgi:hypothetical protein